MINIIILTFLIIHLCLCSAVSLLSLIGIYHIYFAYMIRKSSYCQCLRNEIDDLKELISIMEQTHALEIKTSKSLNVKQVEQPLKKGWEW